MVSGVEIVAAVEAAIAAVRLPSVSDPGGNGGEVEHLGPPSLFCRPWL